MNGGTCFISNNIRYCDCMPGYTGLECEVVKNGLADNVNVSFSQQNKSSLLIYISIFVCILILLGLGVTFFVVRRRQLFTHERLQENDYNNPMYQDRDAEPFTLDADKVRFKFSLI